MTFRSYLETFKIQDPKDFPTEYDDPTVNRERHSLTKKVSTFLDYFNLYPAHYSAYERRFLLKFDISVFFFLGASFYTKYLDSSNISSAYVSGMKEALNITGNELNYFTTFYTIGYAIFQIPITLLIIKPHFARYLLIACEFVWGMLTLCLAFAKNSKHVYVIRFFIGVAEACSFPSTYVIFSSWLTEEELYKRAGIYGAFAVAGQASSGALQTRAREALGGINGLEGWQWQFIIDAVITVGITLYGFFLFPGIPSACKRFGLFTKDDMTFARKRLENKIAVPTKFTKKSLKHLLTTWQFPVCTLMWVFHHSTWNNTNLPLLYMKSRTDIYTTSQVTTTNSYMFCVGIPSTIFISPLMQALGKLPVVTVALLTGYYASIVAIIWPSNNNSFLISAFFICRIFVDGLSQPLYAWCASLCRDDVEKKALMLSFMQAAVYATNAWVQPIQFNMKWSPKFHVGYIINLIFLIMTHVFFMVMWFLDRYDLRLIPRFAGNRHFNDEGYMEKASAGSSLTDSSTSVSEIVTVTSTKK